LIQELNWSQMMAKVLDKVESFFSTSSPKFTEEAEIGTPNDYQRHEKWIYQAITGLPWHLRLRSILALFFPSATYMQWRYQPNPTWTWPMYYPVRWNSMRAVLSSRRRP
jgi:hypothetical protein